VNDNCQVIGCDRKLEDQIRNLIASNIDPRPHFDIFSRVIEEKEIIIVDVKEGDNKPYCHRQKGFFIRSNANDRHPTRSEMDSFYPTRPEVPYSR
ncbi:MAG: helix-turn-helix domain-containing protein, partial [Promethearchaeota archaeon]